MNGLGMRVMNHVNLVNSPLHVINIGNNTHERSGDLSAQVMNLNLHPMSLNMASPSMTGFQSRNSNFVGSANTDNISNVYNSGNGHNELDKKKLASLSDINGTEVNISASRKSGHPHLADPSNFGNVNTPPLNSYPFFKNLQPSKGFGGMNMNDTVNSSGANLSLPTRVDPTVRSTSQTGSMTQMPSDAFLANSMTVLKPVQSGGSVISRSLTYQNSLPSEPSPRIFNTPNNFGGFSNTTNLGTFGGNSFNQLSTTPHNINYLGPGLMSPPISPDMSVATHKQFHFPVQTSNLASNVSQQF